MAYGDINASIRAFVKARPWEWAGEGGALIFGLEEAENTSYVVVSGAENGYAFALCRSTQALSSYAALLNKQIDAADEMELISLQLDQDCLECLLMEPNEQAMNEWLSAFGVVADEWPERTAVLRRRIPGWLPMMLEEKDEPALEMALLAAADLTVNPNTGELFSGGLMEEGWIFCAKADGKGGFVWEKRDISSEMRIQYPSPALEDELAAHRLRRLPVNGMDIRCAIRRLPMPLDERAERVPTVMLLMDDQELVAAPIVADYDAEYGTLASEYLGYVEEHGRPRRILAADPRAYCLLSELSAQLSTPIQRVGSMPEVDEAMRGFMEYLRSSVELQQDEDEPDEIFDQQRTDRPGLGAFLYDGHEALCDEMQGYIEAEYAQCQGEETEESFLLRVTYPEDSNFWMYLAEKKDGSLRQLDQFLRDVWVECCGHLSLFCFEDTVYSCNCREMPGRSMNAKLMSILEEGMSFRYEYDMGSPTELLVEVVGTIRMPHRREKVFPLARNFMPKYKCVRCGRRGELVSRMDMGPIEKGVFCARCAQKEDIEGLLPLVNSPRTGICGYGVWFDEDFED